MLYFQVNSPRVVHETLDDEVIIVNLDTGIYYSLDTSAVWVWRAVLKGYSFNQMIDEGLAGFTASESEIAKAVTEFLSRLQTEGIITPVDSAPEAAGILTEDGTHAGEKFPFSAPQLERYTDMEDLLLLDPIHDVDDSGWPNTKHKR